jgi:general secretion pathway protein E
MSPTEPVLESPRLGELLVQQGACTAEQVQLALLRQKDVPGRRLGELLIEQKALSEDALLRALARQLELDYAGSVEEEDLDPAVLRRVPRAYMKTHGLLPLRSSAGALSVLTSDPLRTEPLLHLETLLDVAVRPVVAPASVIQNGILSFDQMRDSAQAVISDMDSEILPGPMRVSDEPQDLLDVLHDAPLVKLVNVIFSQAVQEGASDIHVEPFERSLKVRYRIDGVLYDRLAPPKHLQPAIVARIKVMAGLDIAEKRLPQDGRLALRVGGSQVDVRVSTLPTGHGERVVLRLLDKKAIHLGLSELGLSSGDRATLESFLRRPHGIVLVTGPTGSGKTTTLYAALSTINSSDKNIITVEDPIEYDLKGVGQIQVSPKIDLTFAAGLRSILRQDPDVIMVGEIRDRETAEVAIQASLTGHLVLSTLHTNDAPGAVVRLVEMGIEPFLVASSLLGVVGQRLVRVLCTRCRERMEVSSELEARFGGMLRRGARIYRSAGCTACLETGYQGRVGLYEMLVVDEQIQTQILAGAAAPSVRAAARSKGMRSLLQDGLDKVLAGTTSLEEVLRVAGET